MSAFIQRLSDWFSERNCGKGVNSPALCPLPTPLNLPTNARILVFAPHPDDEILGCGGTLALLARLGCTIKVVIVTDGAGAGGLPEGAGPIRQEESRQGLHVMGIDDVVCLDEPDGAFAPSRHFDETISSLLSTFRPDMLLIPSILDYHRDHVAIGKALLRCWRHSGLPATALLYEVWAPLPANRIVDISAVLELKHQALAQHKTALAQMDYAGSNRGLSLFRGLYLGKDTAPKYAEAFLELRQDSPSQKIAGKLLQLRWLIENSMRN